MVGGCRKEDRHDSKLYWQIISKHKKKEEAQTATDILRKKIANNEDQLYTDIGVFQLVREGVKQVY